MSDGMACIAQDGIRIRIGVDLIGSNQTRSAWIRSDHIGLKVGTMGEEGWVWWERVGGAAHRHGIKPHPTGGELEETLLLDGR